MQKEPKVAAFEAGVLRFFAVDTSSRELVLALPLNRLIVRMVRVPADQDAVEFATSVLKDLSPYPDEPLAVSCETVSESAEGKVVLAAALPESSADDIAEALDAEKLSVVRIDALALGALRCIWGDLGIEEGEEPKRRLVILRSPDCLTLIVLDGDQPASIRAISLEADLRRETTLSLLEAEDFNGPKELVATIEREVPAEEALVGIRDRASDSSAFNAVPESWNDVLIETRFKAKLIRNVAVAGGIWLLIMAVLMGVPFVYGFMTDYMNGLRKDHNPQYKIVYDIREKTKLVRKYSDHSKGALEVMKSVSDLLPVGITLSSWTYAREKGLDIKGESSVNSAIYELKDRLVALADPREGEPLFKAVNLGSVNSQKEGVQKFDLECNFEEEEGQ